MILVVIKDVSAERAIPEPAAASECTVREAASPAGAAISGSLDITIDSAVAVDVTP